MMKERSLLFSSNKLPVILLGFTSFCNSSGACAQGKASPIAAEDVLEAVFLALSDGLRIVVGASTDGFGGVGFAVCVASCCCT